MSKPFCVAVWRWYKKSRQRSHGSLFVLVLRRSVSLTHSQTTRAGKHICPVEWLQHSWRELLSSCRNHPSSRKSTFWRPSFLNERGRDARFQREDSNRLFQTFSSRNTAELTRRGGRFRCLSLNRYQISQDF